MKKKIWFYFLLINFFMLKRYLPVAIQTSEISERLKYLIIVLIEQIYPFECSSPVTELNKFELRR